MLATTRDEPRLFGRYRATRLLKAGQGIETYLGSDADAGTPVVIKAAPRAALTASAQRRLEHEAQVLGELRSPYLTPLLHLGHDAQRLFLVMPFVDGVTLQSRLERGPLGVRESIVVATCVLRALEVAHDHGVLHRDVKPGNIVVDDHAPIRTATLIDFGLARSGRLEASIREQPAGTVRYMSPEQAGLVDHDVGARADLYSLGIVLYECLAGRTPFESDSVSELLRHHLSQKPPELRAIGIRVPRALDELIQRLLRKDPRDRYQSTDAVIADLTAIDAALAQGVEEPALVVGLHDRRGTLTEAAFIGRTSELATLAASVMEAQRGVGSLIYVEAESGGGKSRLLDEAAHRAAQEGAWVFRGQGVAYTAQRPFQVLDGLVTELSATLRAEPNLAASLRERLDQHALALAGALHGLAEPLGLEPTAADGASETHGEARTLVALAALLRALGSSSRPVLLLLDDCQWADEVTIRFFGEWKRSCEKKMAHHAIVVAAFRSDEVPPEHLIRRNVPMAAIPLTPLRQTDIRQLVESMAGPVPDEAVDAVERISGGSPFMAAAVLQGLVETKALIPRGSGWIVDPVALSDARSSRRAAVVLMRRLELLPEATVELLSVGAVLGKAFDIDFAMALAAKASRASMMALDDARSRQIIWVDRAEKTATFVHDKLREAVLEALPQPRRLELHRAAAEKIEASTPERSFEIAYHFDAADEPRRAFPFALAAAEQARAQHALDIAERQYAIAERTLSERDAAVQAQVYEGLGDVLTLRGSYDRAVRCFARVRERATDQMVKLRIASKLGECEFKRGNSTAASEALESGLRLLGHKFPTSMPAVVVALLWQILVQIMHSLFPSLFLGRRVADDLDRLVIRFHSRLAHTYYFINTVQATWASMKEMNSAERFEPTLELGQAYANHAVAAANIPWIRRGLEYGERSLRIRRDLGDVWGTGQSHGWLSLVYYHGSRYAETLEQARESIRILERAGGVWEAHLGQYDTGLALGRLGRLAESEEVARNLYESAQRTEDLQATGISLVIWAKATNGAVPEHFIEQAMGRVGSDAQSKANLLHADGIRLFYAGNLATAAERFEEAIALISKAMLRNEYIAPIYAWLATVRRTEAEKSDPWAPRTRGRLLERAWKAARRAFIVARSFKNNLPHVHRELGILSALQGRERAARRHLRASLEIADRQGACQERKDTLMAYRRLARAHGWEMPEGVFDDVSESSPPRPTMSPALSPAPSAAIPVSLSLADRFATVLDSGHRIASALSKDAVYGAIRETAERLLRGDKCIIIEPGPDGQCVPAFGQGDFSHTVAARTMQNREPVVVAEGMSADSSSESIIFAGVRSAICVPFEVRGEIAGCFYVTHGQIGGLFGDDEVTLARFIAVLAGAALENAAGFAKVEALSRSLEVRVQERTAELEATLAELHRSQDRLLYLAITDELTGLYTRRFLMETLAKQMQLLTRVPSALTCLVLDVDRFKSVNDTLGHAAGDKVLQQIADVLKKNVRTSDVVARFGGEEFVVVLPGTDATGGCVAAEKIRAAVEANVLDPVNATVSIGVADFVTRVAGERINSDDIVKDMIRRADEALYRAKHNGRNRVERADPQNA